MEHAFKLHRPPPTYTSARPAHESSAAVGQGRVVCAWRRRGAESEDKNFRLLGLVYPLFLLCWIVLVYIKEQQK